MKSQHFGERLECSASTGAGRYTVLVLIASLASILLWPIGAAAERCGVHERLRPGSRKRRAYSRLLLTLEDCRTTMAEVVDAIGPLDHWPRVTMMRCSPGERPRADLWGYLRDVPSFAHFRSARSELRQGPAETHPASGEVRNSSVRL